MLHNRCLIFESNEMVPVTYGLAGPIHWSLKLEIKRQSALILAVNPGLIFSGEEKNCEKLGSCAFADLITRSKVITTIVCLSVFIVKRLT